MRRCAPKERVSKCVFVVGLGVNACWEQSWSHRGPQPGVQKELMPQGDGMGEAGLFHLGYRCPWRQMKLNCLIHAHQNSGQKILNPKATGTKEEIFFMWEYVERKWSDSIRLLCCFLYDIFLSSRVDNCPFPL